MQLQLHELWLTDEQFSAYSKWKFGGADMAAAPRSLVEFRDWWNQWKEGVVVHVPDLNHPGSCTSAVLHQSTDLGVLKGHDPFERLDCKIEVRAMYPDSKQEAVPTWEYHSDWADRIVLLIFRVPFAPKGADRSRVKSGDDLFIQTNYSAKSVRISQSVLRQGLYSDWPPGDYNTSFPDLAAASQGFEQEPLSSVVQRIRDIQNKGDVPLEFFGFKIPGAEAGKWGLVLLLATQFYFWIHLHELSNRIRPTDAGWNVAWIGMYSSKISVIATLVSSCALPVAVGVLFGLRLSKSNTVIFGHHSYMVAGMAIMNALIIAVAIATIMRIIRLQFSKTRSRDKLRT
jgi:hypothetical protein